MQLVLPGFGQIFALFVEGQCWPEDHGVDGRVAPLQMLKFASLVELSHSKPMRPHFLECTICKQSNHKIGRRKFFGSQLRQCNLAKGLWYNSGVSMRVVHVANAGKPRMLILILGTKVTEKKQLDSKVVTIEGYSSNRGEIPDTREEPH